jgi:hypothetical protein
MDHGRRETMSKHIDKLLPFYLNRTLEAEEACCVEEHLAGCARCQASLTQWERLALAAERAVPEAGCLPPLSPLVFTGLHRLSLRQALASSLSLVWAQRVVVLRGLWLLVLAVVMVVVVLGTMFLGNLTLFALVPILAALIVTQTMSNEYDPAYEITEALPTPTGTLIFARLTLVLALIVGLAGTGSILVAALDGGEILILVMAWLGPMLVLSAFATLLSLLWRPLPAAGITLLGWGLVILQLAREQMGVSVLLISLRPLLHPDGLLVAAELLLAGFLWLLAWLWLSRGTPPALRLEQR